MPKPQIIGDGIWSVIAYRNGQHGAAVAEILRDPS
jgi:hypothetical protein